MGAQVSKAVEARDLLRAAKHGEAGNVAQWVTSQPKLAWAARSKSGGTVWHVAAKHGQAAVLNALAEFVRTVKLSEQQRSMLLRRMHADDLQSHDLTTNDALLKQLVNLRTTKGETPLMLACDRGCSECVGILIDFGADLWLTEKRHGNSCLHYAARKAHVDCILKLFEVPLPPAPSQSTGVPSRTGSFIDLRNAAGYAALHYAAWSNDVEAVKALLLYGPDLAVCNVVESKSDWLPCKTGCTPLHLAVMKGNIDMVRELVKFIVEDPRVNAHTAIDPRTLCNRHGVLPYDMAIMFGRWRMAALLVPGRSIQDLFDILVDRSIHGGQSQAEIGPPKLATIAASALQRKLLNSIRFAEYELESGTDPVAGSRVEHLKDPRTAKRMGLQAGGGARKGDLGVKGGSFSDLERALVSSDDEEVKDEVLAMGKNCKRLLPDDASFSSKTSSKEGSFSNRPGPSGLPSASPSAAVPSSTPNWWYDKSHHGGSQFYNSSVGDFGGSFSMGPRRGRTGKDAREYLQQLEGAFDEDFIGGLDKAAGGEDDEEEEEGCGICFSETHQVVTEQCGHKLCAACAREICLKHKYTPATCPFCRQVIHGFVINQEAQTTAAKKASGKGPAAASLTSHAPHAPRQTLKRSAT